MTLRINSEDKINCYFCDKKEAYDESEVFESVSVYDGDGAGTMTFFLCPGCRKKALQGIVTAEFRKRFIRSGTTGWEDLKVKEVEE